MENGFQNGPNFSPANRRFWHPFLDIDLFMFFGRPLAPFRHLLAPFLLASFWLPLAPFGRPFGSKWLIVGVLWLHFGHSGNQFSHFCGRLASHFDPLTFWPFHLLTFRPFDALTFWPFHVSTLSRVHAFAFSCFHFSLFHLFTLSPFHFFTFSLLHLFTISRFHVFTKWLSPNKFLVFNFCNMKSHFSLFPFPTLWFERSINLIKHKCPVWSVFVARAMAVCDRKWLRIRYFAGVSFLPQIKLFYKPVNLFIKESTFLWKNQIVL